MNFKSIGFKNLYIVCSEPVKFLLTNTEYESIQALKQKIDSLEAGKKETEKALKTATSTATTASNKVDECKTYNCPRKTGKKVCMSFT